MSLFQNIFGGQDASGINQLLSPEQRAAIERQSMLSLGSRLLQSSRTPERVNLAQALGGALEAGMQAQQAGQASAVQQILMGQKIQEAKDARDRNARIDAMFGGGQAVAPINLPTDQAGRVGPTAQRAGMEPQSPVMPALANLTDAQRMLIQLAPPDQKISLLSEFEKNRIAQAEVTGQPFEVTDATGKPVMVQQTKGGKITTLEGFGPKREVVLQNLGGRTVAINKTALRGGESFQQTMSPSEAANISLRQQETDLIETPEGFVRAPRFGGGQARPVVGPTGQPVRGKPSAGAGAGDATEGERKAATLLSRIQIAEAQMSKATGGAPTLLSSIEPRLMKSSDRKQVEDAQLEFLDAALTLSTGAAYTKEQLEGTRDSYFPRFGDDAATIQAKEERRQNLIQSARIAAGRAGGQVPSLPTRLTEQPAAQTPAAARPKSLQWDAARGVFVYQ